jgi:hypothetical protein
VSGFVQEGLSEPRKDTVDNRGLLGIRVIWCHRAIRPKKQTFSVIAALAQNLLSSATVETDGFSPS